MPVSHLFPIPGAELLEALNVLNDALMVTSFDGSILWINRSSSELTGYSLEELPGQAPRILKFEHHQENAYEDIWKGLAPNGSWYGRLTNRRKDGSLYEADVRISSIYTTEGQYFISAQSKISESDAFSSLDTLYRIAIEEAPVPIAVTREDRVMYANKALADLMEIPRKQFAGARMLDLMAPESHDIVKARLANRDRGLDNPPEVELILKNGKRICLESHLRRIMFEGKPAIINLMIDLTSRKAAERDLQASEEPFRRLFEASSAGIAICDSSGRYVRVNQRSAGFSATRTAN
jgi:PAS domain S-box-containing protein